MKGHQPEGAPAELSRFVLMKSCRVHFHFFFWLLSCSGIARKIRVGFLGAVSGHIIAYEPCNIIGISRRVDDHYAGTSPPFRVQGGNEYLGMAHTMVEAVKMLQDAGCTPTPRKDEAKEVATFQVGAFVNGKPFEDLRKYNGYMRNHKELLKLIKKLGAMSQIES